MTNSITCPRCGRTSWNPGDIRNGYCGWCHWWTSDETLGSPENIALAEAEGAITPFTAVKVKKHSKRWWRRHRG